MLRGAARLRMFAIAGASLLAATSVAVGPAWASSDPGPAPGPASGAPAFTRFDASRIDPRLLSPLDPHGEVTVIVALADRSVSETELAARGRGVRMSVIERGSIRNALLGRQNSLLPSLRTLGATITGQYQDAYNGIRVRIARGQLQRVLRLPGVVRVAAAPIYRLSNATSERFTSVPAAWSAGTGLTGKGVKIAIIDSGIDYYHADFGGSGDPADYAADDGLTIGSPAFPSSLAIIGPIWVRTSDQT